MALTCLILDCGRKLEHMEKIHPLNTVLEARFCLEAKMQISHPLCLQALLEPSKMLIFPRETMKHSKFVHGFSLTINSNFNQIISGNI